MRLVLFTLALLQLLLHVTVQHHVLDITMQPVERVYSNATATGLHSSTR